jgi:hypothetical protein
MDEAGVVHPHVLVREAAGQLPRLLHGPRRASEAELIGQGQDQDQGRLLMVRVDIEDVVADALRHQRVVQHAISVGFCQRGLDALLGQGLEDELRALVFPVGCRITHRSCLA